MFRAHMGIKERDKGSSGSRPSMQAFTTLTAIAAPLPMVNVDTDKIIPARHLKTIKRTGLGVALFETLRYRDDGSERADFVLNREPYRHAAILIAGENFGCGSSREHAPWALLDFGIRCVIAPSFADIFFNNCFKNGVLPVVLPKEQVEILMREAEEAPDPTFTVDLERQEVRRPTGNQAFAFEVDPFRKHCLLNGLDDVGLTMQKARKIDDFEARQRARQPWLYRGAA
jgi:3-isopropylmalate/(R)-2-methylmalate dehydratase small subunit